MKIDMESQKTLINSTLKQMVAQAELLVRTTSEEGLALREADIDMLNEKVQAKKEVVATLTELDSHFRNILAQHGLTPQADISIFLSNVFHDLQLSEDWDNYIRLMHVCDKNNRENSSLVNVGLRHTKQAIEFLRSCVGEQDDKQTYQPAQYMHKSASSANSNIIAKA